MSQINDFSFSTLFKRHWCGGKIINFSKSKISKKKTFSGFLMNFYVSIPAVTVETHYFNFLKFFCLILIFIKNKPLFEPLFVTPVIFLKKMFCQLFLKRLKINER